MNTLADPGELNTITRRISGGLNGLADRLSLWAKAREADQAGLHKDDLAMISNAAARRSGQASGARTAPVGQRASPLTRLACAIALPLLICSCQSSLPRIQPVAVQCQPVPKPAAWFMEERAPDLIQRMLKELSESPTPATKD